MSGLNATSGTAFVCAASPHLARSKPCPGYSWELGWWELGWASSVMPGILLSSVPVPALLYMARSWHSSEWCVTNPQIHPRAFSPSQHHSLGPHHPYMCPCLPLMMVTEGSAHKSCGLAPAASPFVVLLSFHCQLNGVFFPSLLTLLLLA